jgi:hypothetical protein
MNAAEVQVVLEGVALPAHKRGLIAYARTQDEQAAQLLEALPDREFRSLDEVGEALAPVQPSWPQPDARTPRDESGKPPGGDAYVDRNPEPGAVREPNPPDDVLQQQSKTQKQQQERQQQLG